MQSWDPIWEKIYKENEWGKYPEIPVVVFVARNFYKFKERSKIRILDLGCGTGAQLWFLAREGFAAYGIEGSKTAVDKAKLRIKNDGLNAEIVQGDMINLPYKDNFFDAIIDAASIQHNTPEKIKEIVREIHRTLKKGGKIFSMLVAKDKSLEEEEFGIIHFFTEDDIKTMFKDFKNLKMDYVEYTENNRDNLHKSWIVSAEKG